MRKKYPTYQGAILGQANDFNLVREAKIADDGSVEVIGWGTEENIWITQPTVISQPSPAGSS
jgi:hypothetical protein